jgi:glycosyltransferase involved in cell wall biosynthesis
LKIAVVNLVSQTPPGRWETPRVVSNRQSIGVILGRALMDAGHEAVVIMSDVYRPECPDEGVSCVYLPTRLGRLFSPALIPFTPGLVRELESSGYDLVLCSELFQWSTVLAALAKARGGFRLYVWQEIGAHQRLAGGTISRGYHATIGRWVTRRTDGFFPRAAQSGAFLRRLGVPAERIGPLIPNGADGSIFCPGGARSCDPLIACVGTLVPLKQPDVAMRAFASVRRSEPAARLLVKGVGPMEQDLRALAHDLDLADTVEFDTSRSSHEQMAALYRSAWVGVYPTNGEGASLSPVEMTMCGTPVVVSEKLYHSEALEKLGGALVTGFDPEEIARAVLSQVAAVRSGEWSGEQRAAATAAEYSSATMAARLLEYDRTVHEGRR